jgi:hypothetical protein
MLRWRGKVEHVILVEVIGLKQFLHSIEVVDVDVGERVVD